MLKTAIVQHAVHVHNDCTRVEARLRTAAQKVQSELKRCRSGRMRQSLLGGEHHLFVLQGETVDLAELLEERELTNADGKVEKCSSGEGECH